MGSRPKLRSVPPVPPAIAAVLSTMGDEARASRPVIRIRPEEYEVVDEAMSALSADPGVYQRGGQLVHVVRDAGKLKGVARPPAAPRIATLSGPALRERLTVCAAWEKWSKQQHGWEPAHPPEWAVAEMLDRGEWWGVLPLEGVVEMPVLRRDGSVLDAPGYDPTTGLLFEPTGEYLPVPDAPSREAARSAINELLDVVVDFPFKSPEHKAAWLAAVLTPFARFAFAGPVPLFLIDANTRGTGKSLLADTVSAIVGGRHMSRMVKPDSEEEWRKRITSIAMAGDQLVLIDNVTGLLGGAALDTLLTGTEWSDRALGGNQMVRLPLVAVWYATGNNVALNGDTTRRTLHIRLETKLEHPEERRAFAHGRILDWIAGERPRLVRAALTILRAYCLAGRPGLGLKPWGSYEGWSGIVRPAIVWAGQGAMLDEEGRPADLPDPAATMEALREQSDTEMAALKDLLMGLREMNPGTAGITAREIVNRLDNAPQSHARMRNALDEIAAPKAGKYDPKTIGRNIRRFRERVVEIDGFALALKQARLNKDGVAQWTVEETQGGLAG